MRNYYCMFVLSLHAYPDGLNSELHKSFLRCTKSSHSFVWPFFSISTGNIPKSNLLFPSSFAICPNALTLLLQAYLASPVLPVFIYLTTVHCIVSWIVLYFIHLYTVPSRAPLPPQMNNESIYLPFWVLTSELCLLWCAQIQGKVSCPTAELPTRLCTELGSAQRFLLFQLLIL